MIIAAADEDYSSLLLQRGPGRFRLADTPIAPPEVLEMLAGVAAQVRASFAPASWLIIEQDEVVGLCSITRSPRDGVIDIGYGVAPSRQNRGIAGRAIGEIVRWARGDSRVHAITAETSTTNIASQRVLARNGFLQTGIREDEEDGSLLCWSCATM